MLVWNPAASSSRRSFSVGQLGVTAAFALAHDGDLLFPGAGSDARELHASLRSCDEFGYPMKKCRSHQSMAPTSETVMEEDDLMPPAYAVASAPSNAVPTLDDPDACGCGSPRAHDLCCGEGSAQAGADTRRALSRFAGHDGSDQQRAAGAATAVAPAAVAAATAEATVEHSATASTTLSSLSGASSPAMQAQLRSIGLESLAAAAAAAAAAGEGVSAHAVVSAVPSPCYQPQPAPAPAPAPAQAQASAVRQRSQGMDRSNSSDSDGDDCGGSLIGPFGMLSASQWDELNDAIRQRKSDGPLRRAGGAATVASAPVVVSCDGGAASGGGGGCHPSEPAIISVSARVAVKGSGSLASAPAATLSAAAAAADVASSGSACVCALATATTATSCSSGCGAAAATELPASFFVALPGKPAALPTPPQHQEHREHVLMRNSSSGCSATSSAQRNAAAGTPSAVYGSGAFGSTSMAGGDSAAANVQPQPQSQPLHHLQHQGPELQQLQLQKQHNLHDGGESGSASSIASLWSAVQQVTATAHRAAAPPQQAASAAAAACAAACAAAAAASAAASERAADAAAAAAAIAAGADGTDYDSTDDSAVAEQQRSNHQSHLLVSAAAASHAASHAAAYNQYTASASMGSGASGTSCASGASGCGFGFRYGNVSLAQGVGLGGAEPHQGPASGFEGWAGGANCNGSSSSSGAQAVSAGRVPPAIRTSSASAAAAAGFGGFGAFGLGSGRTGPAPRVPPHTASGGHCTSPLRFESRADGAQRTPSHLAASQHGQHQHQPMPAMAMSGADYHLGSSRYTHHTSYAPGGAAGMCDGPCGGGGTCRSHPHCNGNGGEGSPHGSPRLRASSLAVTGGGGALAASLRPVADSPPAHLAHHHAHTLQAYYSHAPGCDSPHQAHNAHAATAAALPAALLAELDREVPRPASGGHAHLHHSHSHHSPHHSHSRQSPHQSPHHSHQYSQQQQQQQLEQQQQQLEQQDHEHELRRQTDQLQAEQQQLAAAEAAAAAHAQQVAYLQHQMQQHRLALMHQHSSSSLRSSLNGHTNTTSALRLREVDEADQHSDDDEAHDAILAASRAARAGSSSFSSAAAGMSAQPHAAAAAHHHSHSHSSHSHSHSHSHHPPPLHHQYSHQHYSQPYPQQQRGAAVAAPASGGSVSSSASDGNHPTRVLLTQTSSMQLPAQLSQQQQQSQQRRSVDSASPRLLAAAAAAAAGGHGVAFQHQHSGSLAAQLHAQHQVQAQVQAQAHAQAHGHTQPPLHSGAYPRTTAAANAAAAAAAANGPQSPGAASFRRSTVSMAPPPSYTTYGYRRARSSLAALDGPAACAACGAVGGGCACGEDSDSSDDTEEATRRITAAFRTHTGMNGRSTGLGLLGPAESAPTTPTADAAAVAARRDPWASGGMNSGNLAAAVGVVGQAASSAGNGGGGEGGESGVGAGTGAGEEDGNGLTRKRSSYHLTNSHAAVELFLRLNHARQTMDFVKRQTQLFAALDKSEMSVWEALHSLDELREYEAVLMAEQAGEAQEVSELGLLDHAFQTAELCRLHHPDLEWMHLVGLIHGLGKLLAHRMLGSQPQWAICGETYPLGCRFSPHILGAQYFTANPDRRRRLYNTQTGIYGPGCGLLNVVMSWSGPEYLYLVLLLNQAKLPQDAVWLLRHSKFSTLTRPHSCYLPLCGADDLRRLPLLRSFQALSAYRRTPLPEGFALQGAARTAYYTGLIDKYIGGGKLRW